jgi:hypothetical protein
MHKLLKKSQFWYYDLVLGITIFSLVIVMASMFLKDTTLMEQKESESYIRNTQRLSDVLFSEGIPSNWTADDVFMPGIMTDGRLDIIKAGILSNISKEDYERSKMMLGVDRNYHVSFAELDGSAINISDIGGPGNNLTDVEGNFITVNRYVVLEEQGYSKVIQMEVQTWD